ncbi:MAG: flagellar hook-associated protein FlgK, partial [Proteobacteria bacterium]|nr:flagellar hook-associated protein FlgK [Pseudomonadota bacterium]
MTVSLNSAISGLAAAQQALDIASNNIANASTPGYTRKIAQQEDVVVAGQGFGARTLTLTRSVDDALIASVNKQSSIAEGYTIRQKYLDHIMDFHGASDSTQPLSAQLTALADSFAQ